MIGRTLARFPQRLFEWMTACMMLGIAVTISISPRTIESGGFHLMQDIALSAHVLGWAFALAGTARIVALYANGHWPVCGPWCRAAGAAGGAFLWVQMCLALFQWSEQSGYVSVGVPVYFWLFVGEVISCYRAASDGRAN